MYFSQSELQDVREHTLFDPDFGLHALVEGKRLRLDLSLDDIQLDSAFATYGVTGDTKKKAKIFFLQAAKFAELKLSPLLMRRGRVPSVRKMRRSSVRPLTGEEQGLVNNHSSATSKTIQLKNGATLTITITGNLLELDATDLELVYGIMDQIRSRANN